MVSNMKIYELIIFDNSKVAKLLGKKIVNIKPTSLTNLLKKTRVNPTTINNTIVSLETPVKQEVTYNDDDTNDYIDALDPVLGKLKRQKARVRAKQKLSYLTEIFYASLYKNYHDKLKIRVAINRFKKIEKTIEKNNEETKTLLARLEEIKNENVILKQKNERVLIGYNEDEALIVRTELEKINDLTEQMQQM